MKIKIPHPFLNIPKVRKDRYRRILLAAITATLAAHMLIPAYEAWIELATNLAFFWEPTIEV